MASDLAGLLLAVTGIPPRNVPEPLRSALTLVAPAFGVEHPLTLALIAEYLAWRDARLGARPR